MRSVSVCVLVVLVLNISGLVYSQMCCQSTTADCRSCALGQSIEEFCMSCVEQGLNDVGCNDCFAKQLTSRCNIRSLTAQKLIGQFVPKCEADGSFSSMQCHGSTGMCWCVDSNGVEVSGTRSRPGSALPTCGKSTFGLSQCQTAALAGSSKRSVGSFVPRCNSDGSYSALQCHGSTGYCWCVNGDGSEVAGTRRAPGQGQPQCNVVTLATISNSERFCCKAMTAECLSCNAGLTVENYCAQNPGTVGCQQQLTLQTTETMCCMGMTADCLSCNAGLSVESYCAQFPGTDGCSSGEQTMCCMGMSADCLSCNAGLSVESYCAQYPGTDGCPTQATTACLTQKLRSQSMRLIGAFVPQCDKSGAYASRQCHGSTGYCWCVDTNGVEIPSTRGRSVSSATCDVARMTPCQRQAQSSSKGLLGQFIPQCEDDGSYSSLQCHSSTRSCWCVDVNGVEIAGTRDFSSARHACELAVLSQCQQESNAAKLTKRIGTFIPSCEINGSYSAKQCHGSTGQCWCVSPLSGEEILGTRVRGALTC